MKTTLNAIQKHKFSDDFWKNILQYLGKTEADDEPLLISTILKSNGLDDALWCLRAVYGHDKDIRLLAVEYARQVQYLMTDPRSIAALDVAERYALGESSREELADAGDAARDAAWAAGDAGDAARDAARDAAWAATWAAGDAARYAAWAAWDAAGDAARYAGDAAWELQATMLLDVCKKIEDTEK